MPVHHDLQPIVDLAHGGEVPPPAELGVEALRANFSFFCSALGGGPTSVAVEDGVVEGRGGPVPVRIYHPDRADGPLGALVFMHGGGFVIGDLDSHDGVCRQLSDGAGVVVVSVDYRLAPEHPFPAAVEDAEDALAGVAARAGEWGIDPERLAVGGDSAGGNLAAVVARHWAEADGGPPLRMQLLVYPVCDLSHDLDRFPSLRDNGDGYVLTGGTMQFFGDTYLPGGLDRSHPDASPLSAAVLAGVAPALVITAEFDPLRDEGEAYAARLAAAGVPTTLTRYDGAVHTFFQMGEITGIGAEAVAQAAAALRRALS